MKPEPDFFEMGWEAGKAAPPLDSEQLDAAVAIFAASIRRQAAEAEREASA